MPFIHGKDAELIFDGTNISEYLRSEGLNRSRDTHDVTTQDPDGQGARRFIAGLKNATLPLEGPFDAAIDAILDAAYNTDDAEPFIYYPAGQASGGGADATHPGYSGNALITSYETTTAFDSDGAISADFQVDGPVERVVA